MSLSSSESRRMKVLIVFRFVDEANQPFDMAKLFFRACAKILPFRLAEFVPAFGKILEDSFDLFEVLLRRFSVHKVYDTFRIDAGSATSDAVRSWMSRTRDVRTMPFEGWKNSILISRPMKRTLSSGVPHVDP